MAQSNDRSVVLYSVIKKNLSKEKVQISGMVQKANDLLRDVTFKSFNSNSICTIQTELSTESFNRIIDDLVVSYDLPEKKAKPVKNLLLGEENCQKIMNICTQIKDGNMFYGKFVLLKRDKVKADDSIYDLIYAVYAASYEFNPTPVVTREPKKFLNITWDYTEKIEDQYPKVTASQDNILRAFFQNKAIEALELQC